MATFDRSQVKDYINRVDDHLAEYVGAEFCHARLVGFIEQCRTMGLSDAQAQQLLDDANHLMRLAKLGKGYVKLARDPAPEIRIMVLADEERERAR